MISDAQKKRIKLYSPAQRRKEKSKQRRSDAAESAQGHADILQEVNRALPPATLLVFDDHETAPPIE